LKNAKENKLDIFIKMVVILYADDTVLFTDSAVEMQIQLDNFSEYCSLWKLNVNSSKTKVVVFAGGRFPTNNFNFNFDGNNLEIVSDIEVIQFSPKEFLLCKKCSKSFKYKENKKGGKFSLV
jgi:hypothetical protein